MSIKLMAEIWENGPISQVDRFVLLALADFANDKGECWPSIAALAQKTCLTDRGVRNVLRRLNADGWLEVETGCGRMNCNLYLIKTLNAVQPERGSALNTVPKNPEHGSLNPEHGSAEPLEPSRTIREPSDLFFADHRDATISENDDLEKSDLDESSETDQDPEPSLPLDPASQQKTETTKPKSERGSRLSPDWVLPMDWGMWAVEYGLPEQQTRLEADKFRDYWISRPGKDAIKLNWQATWRNWVRQALERRQRTHLRAVPSQEEHMRAFMSGAVNE